ncbi:MAG TPA: NAD(P)-binding domain-containing protein [Bacteroidales bacterium]|nr:NAD(P)-binding domain-containing protein [Bacteroidales bacterium]
MKISVLGTGTVGQTLSSRLSELGHDVVMGTRDVQDKLMETGKDRYGNEPVSEWLRKNEKVKLMSFTESASYGEIVINATNGANSLNALDLATEENLAGKIIIDVSNPLEFSTDPPSLIEGLFNTNSLGEEIQKEFPGTMVVKTFNTMWCGLMVNPGMIKGNHINYISGNDNKAKSTVKSLIKELGWKDESIIDLGDITAARAQESILLIWLRLMGTLKTGAFNFAVVR